MTYILKNLLSVRARHRACRRPHSNGTGRVVPGKHAWQGRHRMDARPPAVMDAGGGRRAGGSATVEFVVMVPFILAMMALVWDLRDYVSFRTELAREMFVVAEMIANAPGGNPIDGVMQQARNKLAANGAGTITIAVVTRGEQRWGGSSEPCTDAAAWCLPRVASVWPATPEAGRFGAADRITACATARSGLPTPDAHFSQGQVVLPNESPQDAETPPREQDWVSRNMRPAEWWVVIDSCFRPNPGLVFGRLVNLTMDLFDVSGEGFILRKRAAWGSVHDRADCAWCESTS